MTEFNFLVRGMFAAIHTKLHSCMFVLQGAQCVDCDQAKKPPRIVLMEWTELPKGEDPDYYILTYQQADAFSQKVYFINLSQKLYFINLSNKLFYFI